MEPNHPPEAPLMGLMARLMRQHHYNSHLSLKDQDVHPGQPPVLFELSRHDGLRQNELAAKMRVKPATVTVMLNRMVKNGHVERRADPSDQRVWRVYLTDKGRSAVKEVHEALNASEAYALQGVTPEEKMLLRRLLLHMFDNVKQYEQIISRQTKEERGRDENQMD
ncbi:MarR family winged helix-turn-helix transcriptional regulator [Paenibacillus hodogayensis]|uniref:MarR family winged helix-turn-helix transcriptional regulator n=1 Tax=Paenibacillus hodogayensis TaxID=279208 RepID=A0ABV5VQ09_9BACL